MFIILLSRISAIQMYYLYEEKNSHANYGNTFLILFVILISSYNGSDVFKGRNVTCSCFSYWYKLEKNNMV